MGMALDLIQHGPQGQVRDGYGSRRSTRRALAPETVQDGRGPLVYLNVDADEHPLAVGELICSV